METFTEIFFLIFSFAQHVGDEHSITRSDKEREGWWLQVSNYVHSSMNLTARKYTSIGDREVDWQFDEGSFAYNTLSWNMAYN